MNIKQQGYQHAGACPKMGIEAGETSRKQVSQ